MALRTFKFRCYPKPEQSQLLAQTFGCVRFVYNWALHLKTETYAHTKKNLSYNQLSAELTKLKKQADFGWLNQVSAVPIQQALRHLTTAYTNFFEGRAAKPSFKKKRSEQAATFANNAFSWDSHTHSLTLAKMVHHWIYVSQGHYPLTLNLAPSPSDEIVLTATLCLF
jgi:putative transposase